MKFSIRDLFLVTMIVALGLGWWVDRGRLSRIAVHAEQAQSTAELLAKELNEDGYHLTVHPDGTMSGSYRFKSLPYSSDPPHIRPSREP